MALDIDFVRGQFPAFSEPSLEGFAHFENAGGSYACGQVVDRLGCFYRRTKVQPYYDFEASVEAGLQMDAAKQRMAAWLNVSSNELHFGPSTSQNTYVLAQALRQYLSTDDEIIVTNQDHEANIGVWSQLADDGIVVHKWQVDPDTGELDPSDLKSLLGPRTRMVAFTHCSNVIGTIHPVREITDLIHEAGAVAVVDGVSFCPHGMPDIPALGADIYGRLQLLALEWGDRSFQAKRISCRGGFHLSENVDFRTRVGLSNFSELALTLNAFGVLNRSGLENCCSCVMRVTPGLDSSLPFVTHVGSS